LKSEYERAFYMLATKIIKLFMFSLYLRVGKYDFIGNKNEVGLGYIRGN